MNETARHRALMTWTVEGPTLQEEDGQKWYELRIPQLPDFFVAAETVEAIWVEYPLALEAFLESYLARGETMPRPLPRQEWVIVTTPPRAKYEKPEVVVLSDQQPTVTLSEFEEAALVA